MQLQRPSITKIYKQVNQILEKRPSFGLAEIILDFKGLPKRMEIMRAFGLHVFVTFVWKGVCVCVCVCVCVSMTKQL